MKSLLKISSSVKKALKEGKPVVALESTIITHGLPYPQNLNLQIELEEIAKKRGVIPATIACINGLMVVGCSKDELELLATKKCAKVSRHNLSYVLAQNLNAGTTVTATMMIAHMASIKVFATGGIGGVHRFAETSFDISQDLEELAKTPVIVVSAGAKAILDLPKTLEYLETKGVPVRGFKTEEFPAFYSRNSGLTIFKVKNGREVAREFALLQKLKLKTGMLVANPIPVKDEIKSTVIEKVIKNCLTKLKQKKITGQAVTPFLLKELATMTKGKSVKANLSLIKNNVEVACEIAKELC